MRKTKHNAPTGVIAKAGPDAITSFSGGCQWLSNFYPVQVQGVGNIVFQSVENAYQAAKVNDRDIWRMCNEKTPGGAKVMMRKFKALEIPNWLDKNTDVMRDLLQKKFQHKVLRDLLLATGDRPLIEGVQWHDYFWGVETTNDTGHNQLGEILMEIRKGFQDTSE